MIPPIRTAISPPPSPPLKKIASAKTIGISAEKQAIRKR
ncbi:unnamed protein product [Bathycoccus prasinos]